MAGAELSKTRQVYLALRDRIARGVFARDGGLPGEQTLAVEFGVSRVTLRRALAALEDEGLICRRRGAGTFLTEHGRPGPIRVDMADFMSQLVAMGQTTEVKLLEFGYAPALPEVSEALGLPDGALVQRSVRTRRIARAPFSYLITCVPELIGRTFTRKELAAQPLLTLLERAGVAADHATQDISAELATPEVARVLGVEVGSPLIAMVRTVFDDSGRGIEHLRAFYRPDRYSVRMTMVRRGQPSDRRWEPVRQRVMVLEDLA
ncbi:UTRA domain-containing protein [Rhodoplanes serenus]|uniref:UTRA domain-containing protein n=1 Tax=Rhodoplanes serenus TaxID=200615 RepID=A0A9X5AUU5_9BRAD|nr:GntR family transcriptional regulator [Rhodoplanes serenus]MTW18770.1 UTRA domain-containing protein [Rhodoplanes serenus]